MTRLTVIGLDGAGFQLLGSWLEDGTLPTLAGLRDRGRWAALRSTHPPLTCPAWRCYSTGLNPGKLGVFGWETLDRDRRTFSIGTANSFDRPDLWDHLGRAGFDSAVVNMPTTHPPRPIDGWLVSDGRGGGSYTAPGALQDELEREVGYRSSFPHPMNTLPDHRDHIDDLLAFVDERFAAARYLRESYDPDFLQLTLFITNAVQHFFLDDDVLRQLWQHVDRRLGAFLGDGNVLVMSDHGANRIETVFNINTWLEAHGYLAVEPDATDYLHRVGINREAVVAVVDRLGLGSTVKRYVPPGLVDAVVRHLPDQDGSRRSSAKARMVDWERTDAVACGHGPVYVLADGRRRERVTAELVAALSAVTGPDGSPIARDVLAAEAVYEGPYVDTGPDLVIEPADNVHISGYVGPEEVFPASDTWKWQCENHRDGLLLAAGPDVSDAGALPDQPTLYDLAPTILHWFDCAVPTDLDGEVIRALFEPGSDPGTREVRYDDRPLEPVTAASSRSPRDEVYDQLVDLGYLSG